MEIVAEEWRPVIGYEGLYEVSDLGRVRTVERSAYSEIGVRRLWKSKVLKHSTANVGYLVVCLRKDGADKTFFIHRLVALAFLGVPTSGKCVNHKDANKVNNNLQNLEWATPKQNTAHAFELGLMHPNHSENHCFAKLKNEDVREIRRRYAAGETQASLAREFSAYQSTISRIVNRRNWAHVA